jgi:hypothetical protein
MDSVRMSLLEGPSMLILVLAVLAIELKRPWVSAALIAIGGLGRETNLVAAPVLVNRMPRQLDELARVVGMVVLTIAPFVLWSLYVRSIYGAARYAGTNNLGVPLTAFAAEWKSTLAGLTTLGWSSLHRFRFVVLASLTIQALFLLTHWEWSNAWWRLGMAYAVLMVILGAAVWAGYPGAAIRVLLPMTFAFNILSVRSRWFWPFVLLGNISILYGFHKIEIPWISQYI